MKRYLKQPWVMFVLAAVAAYVGYVYVWPMLSKKATSDSNPNAAPETPAPAPNDNATAPASLRAAVRQFN